MACLLCAGLALIAELIQDWIINLQPFIYKLLRLNWLKPLINPGFKDKYKLDNSTFMYSLKAKFYKNTYESLLREFL